MKLVIQSNIPDTASKEITISFAKLFVNAEYSELRKILSEDVYIIIYNRERKYGVEERPTYAFAVSIEAAISAAVLLIRST